MALEIHPAVSIQERMAVTHLLAACGLPTSDLSGVPHLFLFRENQDWVGTGGLEFYEDAVLVRSVSIVPSMQAKGYGRQLVSILETECRRQGYKHLYLLTTTAGPFFNRLGYETISRDQAPEAVRSSGEFASICPSTATVMRKRLAPG
jgi:amino-acid N-acetyltransferase